MVDLNSLPTPTQSPEPAVYGTLIAALVSLIPALAIHLTGEQVAALSTVVTILSGFVIRHHVSPAVTK